MGYKEKFAEKGVSKEIVESYVGDYGCPELVSNGLHAIGTGEYISYPFWVAREHIRIKLGVYPEPTAILNAVNKDYPHFGIHTSVEDPNFIAYTPDNSFGESDRQLKTTLGKFLHKVYPVYPDQVIQTIVAEHLAELSNDFELVPYEKISETYRIEKSSTGACMSYDLDKYLTDGHYPTEVYHRPEFAMAILRNREGRISARTLLYHASETDKRFIRVYGDKKLQRKLERSGYKVGTLVGAKLNTIFVPRHDSINGAKGIVVPYIDGNNGVGSSAHSTIALIDNELTVISASAADKLKELFGSGTSNIATNTGGFDTLKPVTSVDFTSVCPLSGRAINVLVDEVIPYFHEGKIQHVYSTDELRRWSISYKKVKGGSSFTLYCPVDTPTFIHRSTTMLDTPEQRMFCGYLRMDLNHYPEESTNWMIADYNTSQRFRLGPNGFLKPADAVTVVDAEGNQTYLHSSDVMHTMVKVHSLKRGEVMYATDASFVRKTRNGRKVIDGVHPVAQCRLTGVWDFTRNMYRKYQFGETFWTCDNAKWSFNDIVGVMRELLNKVHSGSGRALALHAACRWISDYIRVPYNGSVKSLHAIPGTNAPSWKVIYEAMDEHLRESENTKVLNYIFAVEEAEANAYDYNGQVLVPFEVVAAEPAQRATAVISDERFALVA